MAEPWTRVLSLAIKKSDKWTFGVLVQEDEILVKLTKYCGVVKKMCSDSNLEERLYRLEQLLGVFIKSPGAVFQCIDNMFFHSPK